MATVTRLVTKQDVLRVLNKRDAALKALPVPLVTTGGGSTTTLVDTKLGRGTTQANKYDARHIEITGAASDVGEHAAVDDGGFNSTSTLTFSPALTSVSDASTYLLYPHGVSGDLLNQVADEILRQTDAPYVYFPSLVNDSAIETTALGTDWPDVVAPGGTATELVATSANVLFGQLSIHGVADAAGQGWNSQTFDVHETETLMVSVFVRAAVGSVIVQLYNETAPEVVKAVTIDEPAWTEVRFQESVPDDCEQMRIRVISAAAADDFYMAGPVIVQVTGDMRPYTAPSWFVSEEKVRYAFYMPQGRVSEDADSYVALSRQWRAAQAPRPTFINEARGVNPFRIVLRAVWSRPVGIVLSRGFDAFTDNTTATTCGRDYLVAAILERFYRDWDERADERKWARRRRAQEELLGYNLKELRIVPNELVSV